MKSCGSYSRTGEAMLDSTAHAHFTLVPKATKKQGICNNSFLFCGCTNASQCYFIRPLPVLFSLFEIGHRAKHNIRRGWFLFCSPAQNNRCVFSYPHPAASRGMLFHRI